jgi:hypothetical protein
MIYGEIENLSNLFSGITLTGQLALQRFFRTGG